EPAGFNLVSGNGCIAQKHDGRTVLNSQIEMANVEVGWEERLQCRPIETRHPCAFRIIAANFSARCFDRQRPNAVAASDQNFCQTRMNNRLLGVELDLSCRARLIRDPDALD